LAAPQPGKKAVVAAAAAKRVLDRAQTVDGSLEEKGSVPKHIGR